MAAATGGPPSFVIPAEENEKAEEERKRGLAKAGAAESEAGGGSVVTEAGSAIIGGLGEEEVGEFEEERGLSVERYRSKYRLLELRKDEAPVRQNEVRVTQKVRETKYCCSDRN